METTQNASWGARIGSTALVLLLGTGAAFGVAWGIAKLYDLFLVMFQTLGSRSVVPLLVILACGFALTAITAVATRMSGAGGLVAGVVTLALSVVFLLAGPTLWRSSVVLSIVESTGRAGLHLLTVTFTGALLPAGAALLGLGVASRLASRGLRPHPAVGVGVILLVLAAFVGSMVGVSRLYVISGRYGVSSSWSDTGALVAVLVTLVSALLLTASVSAGARGPWGLVTAGALLGVPALLILVFYRQVLGAVSLPSWAMELVNPVVLMVAVVVGAFLVGGGLGVGWRGRAARGSVGAAPAAGAAYGREREQSARIG